MGAAVPLDVLADLNAVPRSARDVLAYRLGAWEPPSLLGGFSLSLGEYLEMTSTWKLPRTFRFFPRHLKGIWELERVGQVPGVAAGKALKMIKTATRAPG